MKTISTSELRTRARPLVRTLERGQTVSLTHRGHKLARILPLELSNGVEADDLLYNFHRLASKRARALTDREIDNPATNRLNEAIVVGSYSRSIHRLFTNRFRGNRTIIARPAAAVRSH